MSNAKTPKLGIPDFPPSSHKIKKNENNLNGEESFRSRNPRFNPDGMDSQVKLKNSQAHDETMLTSSEGNSPNRISIPTIQKHKKKASPPKKKIVQKKSSSSDLDLDLDISDDGGSSNQENSEFNKVQKLPAAMKLINVPESSKKLQKNFSSKNILYSEKKERFQIP